jgi:hypothetical protein
MMRKQLSAQVLTRCLALSLALAPMQSHADRTIRCDSWGHQYRYCPVNTDGRVEMVKQHSRTSCYEGESWGYDPRGVWVDRGCSADFRVGSDDRGRNRKLAVGALVGLAAIVALAAARNKQQADQAASQEVAAYAVGEFRGVDEVEHTDVELSILPGGSVKGHAGANEFTGTFKDGRLQAGRHVFKVERSGNGFLATDEQNPQHRVAFQRVAVGY